MRYFKSVRGVLSGQILIALILPRKIKKEWSNGTFPLFHQMSPLEGYGFGLPNNSRCSTHCDCQQCSVSTMLQSLNWESLQSHKVTVTGSPGIGIQQSVFIGI